MRLRKTIILTLCGILWTTSLMAQQVYTLDECISEALVNNASMKNAANDTEAARHTEREAFTKYFPTVSAAGVGYMANKGLLNMNMGGASMSLLENGYSGGVTATLPVYAGGQIVNSNKLANVGVEVSRLQQKQSENEIRLTTEQYYWQIVMLKEKLVTLSVVEEQLASIHKDVEAAVNVGVTNRNDLLQVNLRKNDTRSTRINVENLLSVSRNLLSQYIGHPTDSIDVATVVDGSLPENPAIYYRQPEDMLTQTNEYGLLQQNVKASHLQYRLSVGKNLPTVAIGGGYLYNDLLDAGYSRWVGFATVSIPLSGWWGGSHDMKKQKLRIQNAENTMNDQSELLIIRMRNAWNAMTDAYSQAEIAIESIEQATENLRLQTDYYRAGICTMSDLLEAQTLFQQSRDRYVEAYAQYEVKKREYLQATGR